MSNVYPLPVVLTLLFLVGVADAQPPMRGRGRVPFGGRGMSGDATYLVTLREIQEELGVSPEQRELLEFLQSDLTDQRRGMFQGGPPGMRRGDTAAEEMQQRFQALSRQGEKLVMAVLEPGQAERLVQLRLRWEGIRALDRDEMIKSLEISDSQLKEIRRIRSGDPPVEGVGGNRNSAGQETQPSQDSLNSRVMAVLSDEQKQNWERMKGKEFDFPERLRRGGQRGFRGRGGNDPGPGAARP